MLRAMQRKCPCAAFLAHGAGGCTEGGGLFGFCCHASDCTTRYYIRLLTCYFSTLHVHSFPPSEPSQQTFVECAFNHSPRDFPSCLLARRGAKLEISASTELWVEYHLNAPMLATGQAQRPANLRDIPVQQPVQE